MDYKNICKQVEGIARQAGEFIARERANFSWDRVEFKGAHDLVSYVDKGAEEMIVAGLRKIVPQAGFITEEGTATDDGQEYRWVVDPLDGTTNFVHGLPPYCTSIALIKGDVPVVGVVYEVTLGEMFTAWQGSKAYLNGKEIVVSRVTTLDHSLIGVGFSYSALKNIDGYMQKIADYQLRTDGIRRLGSAATDIVYVACGRFDAFSQINLAPWDVAAGVLIALQAGARVSDFDGGSNYIFGKQIVATNPHIYDEFMATVK